MRAAVDDGFLPKPRMRILAHLAEHGDTPAWVFDETALDALFKMRPKLIRLAPGVHEQPVITITPEGGAALTIASREFSPR